MDRRDVYGYTMTTKGGPLFFLRWQRWNQAVIEAAKKGRPDLVREYHPWPGKKGKYPKQSEIKRATERLRAALESS